LSKFGCVTKVNYNPETKLSTTKIRIILDCKRSSVSRGAARQSKTALPRATDAVASALKLMSWANDDEAVKLIVADVIRCSRCILADPFALCITQKGDTLLPRFMGRLGSIMSLSAQLKALAPHH